MLLVPTTLTDLGSELPTKSSVGVTLKSTVVRMYERTEKGGTISD